MSITVTLVEALTVAALLAGPPLGVGLAGYLEYRRDRGGRRMDVFRTLMRTRRVPTSGDHVGALNLIEIEFAHDGEVLAAWRELFQHFAATHSRRPDEVILPDAPSAERERRFNQRLNDERQRLLAKLLHAMARVLNFKIEQLEIFEGGYTPQGWETELLEQQAVRNFLIDLYRGNKALPVLVFEGQRATTVAPAGETAQQTLPPSNGATH